LPYEKTILPKPAYYPLAKPFDRASDECTKAGHIRYTQLRNMIKWTVTRIGFRFDLDRERSASPPASHCSPLITSCASTS